MNDNRWNAHKGASRSAFGVRRSALGVRARARTLLLAEKACQPN
jgi:hypothetical protein